MGRRECLVGAADCRGHDHRAEGGGACEHGSWVSEVEAHGTGQEPQVQEEDAQAPGGLPRTSLPSCGDG